MKKCYILFALVFGFFLTTSELAYAQPRESAESKSLTGIWSARISEKKDVQMSAQELQQLHDLMFPSEKKISPAVEQMTEDESVTNEQTSETTEEPLMNNIENYFLNKTGCEFERINDDMFSIKAIPKRVSNKTAWLPCDVRLDYIIIPLETGAGNSFGELGSYLYHLAAVATSALSDLNTAKLALMNNRNVQIYVELSHNKVTISSGGIMLIELPGILLDQNIM